MLRWRLLLGTLLIAALVGLCCLDYYSPIPGVWLMPIVIVVSVMATNELLDLAAMANLRPLKWTVQFGNPALVIIFWVLILPEYCLTGPYRYHIISLVFHSMIGTLIALAGSVLLVLFGEMVRYQKPGGNMGNIAAGIFALVYVGQMLCLAVQMRIIFGIGALASWIIVVKMGDTGAYTVGRLIGRHKMAPRISPGKTIEGAFGALAFSCLGAWLAFRYVVPLSTATSAGSEYGWGWIVFGLLVGAAGMLGDLFESLLKRDVGVKDSSTWLPGFGGVLDIIDSLLLSAPVAWFCWVSGLVGR